MRYNKLMIAREDVERILKLAAHAPSGDNSQPWRFEVRGDAVDLYNVPGKDYSPYNFKERGSLFANGALIENIVIAASASGYAVLVALFPDRTKADQVARLTFKKDGASVDPLAAQIEARTTNRKPYKKSPLLPEHRGALLNAARAADFGEMRFVDDPARIMRFSETVSLSDRLIFEEKSIHDAIFASLRWTRKEEGRGMFVKTMELPPPVQLLLRALKNWSVLAFLNHVRISRIIAAQSARGYAASSAIGMVVMPGNTDESYVKAGRLFERVWLTAARLGVSIQPVTALAYLAERVAAGDAGDLSSSHTAEISRAQHEIVSLFGDPQGTVAMMFRVGYGKAPTARSHKTAPEIAYLS